MNKKIEKALNEQVAREMQSSHNYLAMAVWCEAEGFAGAAEFLYRHSDEERTHMLKIVRYITEKNGVAIIPSVELPNTKFDSIQQLFESGFEGEKKVTQAISKIVKFALDEDDYTTHNFMQWFVKEQLEEETTYRTILDKMKLIGKSDNSNYHIDNEIANINKQVVKQESAEG
jgi:ferritin